MVQTESVALFVKAMVGLELIDWIAQGGAVLVKVTGGLGVQVLS